MHRLLVALRSHRSLTLPAQADADAFTVALRPLADEKAVFATVESANDRAGAHAHRRHHRRTDRA